MRRAIGIRSRGIRRPAIRRGSTGGGGGSAYDFTVTITASRSSGTIPAGVAFNVLTTTGQTGSILHDCVCVWTLGGDDFSDYRRGFIASACYRTAGTKTITCTMYDSAGNVGFGTFAFTANAFTGTDYYVNTGGANSGPGTDTGSPWQTIAYALANMSGVNWRLNLRGGQTHTMTSAWNPPSDTGSNEFLHWRSEPSTGTATISCTTSGMQWLTPDGQNSIVLSDVTLAGPNSGTSSRVLDHPDGYRNCILLNVDITNWAEWLNDGNVPASSASYTFLHSCDYTAAATDGSAWCMGFLEWESNQSLHCVNSLSFTNSSANVQHNLRAAALENSSFWETDFTGALGSAGAHAWKITGLDAAVGVKNIYAGQCYFSCNKGAPVAIKPQNNSGNENEWVEDVVLDGCRIESTAPGNPDTIAPIQIMALRVTILNCWITGRCHHEITIDHQAGLASGRVGDVKIIGFSHWSDGQWADFRLVDVAGSGSGYPFNITVRNCVRHYPTGASTQACFINLAAAFDIAELTESDNSDYLVSGGTPLTTAQAVYIRHGGTDYQHNELPVNIGGTNYGVGVIYSDPLFVSSSDLHLQSGSPCIGFGVDLGGLTKFDADGVDRGGAVDIGAYERA